MPTYDYRCLGCGHHFERFQWMSEQPIRWCPRCGWRVERLLGAGAGLIFKGSGFYITDHRSESYLQAAREDRRTCSSENSSSRQQAVSNKMCRCEQHQFAMIS
jgi:putative FmdB family regulatory protein